MAYLKRRPTHLISLYEVYFLVLKKGYSFSINFKDRDFFTNAYIENDTQIVLNPRAYGRSKIFCYCPIALGWYQAVGKVLMPDSTFGIVWKLESLRHPLYCFGTVWQLMSYDKTCALRRIQVLAAVDPLPATKYEQYHGAHMMKIHNQIADGKWRYHSSNDTSGFYKKIYPKR